MKIIKLFCAVAILLAFLSQSLPAQDSPKKRTKAEIGEEAIKSMKEDEFMRSMWITFLATYGHKEAIPDIAVYLSDPDYLTRSAAADALGDLDAKDLLPKIRELVMDDDPRVRASASYAIAKLGFRDEGIGYLKKLLKDGNGDTKSWSASRLGRLGAKEFIPDFIALLKNSEVTDKYSVLNALSDTDAKESVPALVELFELSKEQVKSTDSMVSMNAGLLQFRMIEVFGKFGAKEGMPYAMQFLSKEEPNDRKTGVKTLGQIGAKEAAPDVVKMLTDADAKVRLEAVKALGIFMDASVLPELEKCLSDGDASVRAQTVISLSDLGDKGSVAAMRGLLEDPSDKVRYTAADALGKMGDNESIPGLVKLLEHKNSDVRLNAVFSLGRLGAADAVPELVKLVGDENAFVRGAVAIVLVQLGAADKVPKELAKDVQTVLDKNWGEYYNGIADAALKALSEK